MIRPSVGRIVHYFTHDNGTIVGPMAATIAYVHNDTRVNLSVVDVNGFTFPRTSVFLDQRDGESSARGNGESFWCEWMDYQKSQAAKTEAAEAALAAKG